MSKHSQHTWNESNIVDDVQFQEKDAELFKNLLTNTEADSTEESSLMSPGSILKGRIVEITKDHVVVDVGLKSEGLVPIEEFSDPSQLSLDAEVEVLLDQAEDDNGQIVLSREKAERLRQWEYILEHCEEGSIVKGRVLRKVKGGLMVDIGMEAFLPGSQIDNKRIKNLDDYIGKTYEFKILKINIDRKNVVVSRRELPLAVIATLRGSACRPRCVAFPPARDHVPSFHVSSHAARLCVFENGGPVSGPCERVARRVCVCVCARCPSARRHSRAGCCSLFLLRLLLILLNFQTAFLARPCG